jgi:hypothetical protein
MFHYSPFIHVDEVLWSYLPFTLSSHTAPPIGSHPRLPFYTQVIHFLGLDAAYETEQATFVFLSVAHFT